ncbi:MAG TPA: FtsX-like permease family protein, partial [Acidimicrobiales bacterium]|nr:FtsX-like permease family protein [Acidimicrobiales bacterium]
RAVKPESIALGVFGLIALLAALLITAQAISRRIRSDVRDLDVLRALGADRVMTVTGSLLGTIGAIFIGAVAAAVVAVALSPIAPIGAVRRIDPAPGFDLDWTVLLGGVASFVVVLSVVSTVLALVVTRPPSRSGPSWKTRRVPGAVRAAVRAGMPPPSVVGIRFAVERNAGRDSVPVSSVLLGAALSVAVVVATLTFASSLNTLVSRPQLYGWNWSYAIAQPGGGNVPPMAENLLSRDPDVAAWSGFNFGNASFDGQTVPILLTRANAPVQPPILSGHAVTGDHEVVLGGATLAQLHKKVGDTVVVTYGTPQDAPIYVPPTRVRIVGTATLPAIGNGATLHPSMGTGAVGAVGIEPPAMQAALLSSDPNLNGPPVIAVRLKSGVAPAAGLASLQRVAAAATRIMAHDPNGGGGFSVLPVQQPAEIVNYRAMGGTPSVLALALAVGAVTALGLLLIASVRRRRRDLALLKTLGFVGRQLAAVVSWQASLIALAGLVIGTPIGIVVGRSLWRLFAGEIYAVPATSVPVSQLLLVAVGALVLANAVATVPARLAAATPAGELLRTE